MKVDVEAIPPRGMNIKGGDWVSLTAEKALGAVPSESHLEVVVYRVDGGVRVKGEGLVRVARTCDRCGEDIELSLGGPIDLRYLPSSHQGPSTLELASDELDVGWFDGYSLDMYSVWSEQLVLWLPDVLRCDTDGVRPSVSGRACRVPVQDPGPDLKRRNPFAAIVLPE